MVGFQGKVSLAKIADRICPPSRYSLTSAQPSQAWCVLLGWSIASHLVGCKTPLPARP
jgi:hypothetical protein